ncbi:unnamed protein product [Didymodactylos carnosus]|uniref:ADP ribosyltransferase domain-containing protein n=1 Tax=Didymodactylos carnosus TaxID=1234261 RepID=A0A8S2J1L7_9BILA|nr:unnamed protein product [Didymodactylos carnosus]CAF3789310.1 unnamed protein product [Didymodactylos carnosus]
MEEPISFPTFTSVGHDDEHSSIELAKQFQFSQLLTDVLLRMESTEAEQQEFIAVCRKQYDGRVTDLRTIEEFERTYSPERAIHWFTKQTFLYLLLNRALRMHNIDLLILFQFFIKDIYQHLHKLQKEQSSTPIRVYRGQLMSNEETGRLLSIEGQLISMNSFLSTSRNRDFTLLYLGNSPFPNDGLQRVLFEIFLDPRFSDRKPFADITTISNFPEEEEILLMLGSIFRLEDMRMENGIWIIQLQQCDDINPDSRTLLDYRSEEHHEESPLYSLATLLSNFGKLDIAERCFLRYLDQLPDNHPDVFWCYLSLGTVLEGVASDNESLRMYKKALAVVEQIYSSDQYFSSIVYVSMGKVYTNIRDYEQALTYLTKALSVFEQLGEDTSGPHNEALVRCLKFIGDVLSKGGKTYEEALHTYQRVLAIREKNHPLNHPWTASAHMDVGGVYGRLGQFDLALKHLDQCLQMQQKSLPPNHPEIGLTYSHMALVYVSKHDLSQALKICEKALDIYRKGSLLPDHPNVVHTLMAVDWIRQVQNLSL